MMSNLQNLLLHWSSKDNDKNEGINVDLSISISNIVITEDMVTRFIGTAHQEAATCPVCESLCFVWRDEVKKLLEHAVNGTE